MRKKPTKTHSVKKTNKEKIITKKKNKKSWKESMTQKQWQYFDNMKDEDIDTSDIPEITAKQWKDTKIVVPKNKIAISLRIDEDILAWFKKHGKGYQSFMNSILRSYYESQNLRNT